MRRAVVIVALALLVLGACGSDDNDSASVSGSGTGSATGSGSGTGGETEAPVQLSGDVENHGTEDATGKSELEVELDDFYIGPTFIKVTPGQKLTLELKNEGEAAHTFTSDALSVDQEVAPGESATLEVTLTDAEAVAFYCRFHKGGGMQGAFFTREGASASEPTVTSGGAGGAAGY
jgi:plastocyanin